MIDELSIKNFKSFHELNNLKLKPITIFCGTNSCGKSTLLQSILSIKQTIESQANNQAFLSNGKYVHLGSFENLVYERKIDNEVEFKFVFDLGKIDKMSLKTLSGLPVKYLFKEMTENDTDELLPEKAKLEFSVALQTIQSNEKKILKPIRVLKYDVVFSSPFKSDTSKIFVSSLSFEWEKTEKYNIKWKNLSVPYFGESKDSNKNEGELKAVCAFNNLIPKIQITEKLIKSKDLNSVHFFIHRFKELLQTFFANYSYIGPLREEAARRYVYENEITEVGLKGENSAFLYLTQHDMNLVNQFFYNTDHSGFDKKTMTLKEAVNEWFDIMGVKGFDSKIENELIQLNLNASSHNDTQVNIADAGFGISQIFPILLEGLRMPKNNTLLLEQPEIHLHPKMQMDMADYFLSLALSQKNVIVETHSEHIINRLVRRIIEDPEDKIKDLIAIYFVHPSEDGASIESIEIDSFQGVINWPKDFFDQTALEQEKIILAGIKKRKQKS
jgi:predicted ATPase